MRKASKGAAALGRDLAALGVPRTIFTIGYGDREWIVYVTRSGWTRSVERDVRCLAETPGGYPVRVVFCGPVRPAGAP